MEIQQLRSVLAIQYYENISKAAEQLFISQSALSAQLKKLEDTLGVVLVNRTTRSISMTDAGMEFCTYAKQVIAAYDRLEKRMFEFKSSPPSSISIAYSSRQRYIDLPEAVADYYMREPSVSLSISNMPEHTMIDQLESGKIDIAFMRQSTYNQFPALLDYCCDTILADPIVIMLSPAHPLASNKELTPEQLEELRFVVSSKGSPLFHDIQKFVKSREFTQIVDRIDVDDHDMMAALVRKGTCAAFCSAAVAHYYGMAAISFTPKRSNNVLMVGLKRHADAPEIKAFREYILEHYKNWTPSPCGQP